MVSHRVGVLLTEELHALMQIVGPGSMGLSSASLIGPPGASIPQVHALRLRTETRKEGLSNRTRSIEVLLLHQKLEKTN
jgi:hypothetical protein